MCNLSYLISRSGILKIISVIVGILSAYGGIRGYIDSDHNQKCSDMAYFQDENIIAKYNDTKPSHIFEVYCDFLWMERSFLGGVCVITLVSITLLLVFLLSETVAKSTISNIIDFGFHFIGIIVLIVCGIFMAFSAMEIDDNICKIQTQGSDCQLYYEKIGAAGLSALNGVIFALIVFSVNRIRMFEKVEEV